VLVVPEPTSEDVAEVPTVNDEEESVPKVEEAKDLP
jgi:hypothetical protein